MIYNLLFLSVMTKYTVESIQSSEIGEKHFLVDNKNCALKLLGIDDYVNLNEDILDLISKYVHRSKIHTFMYDSYNCFYVLFLTDIESTCRLVGKQIAFEVYQIQFLPLLDYFVINNVYPYITSEELREIFRNFGRVLDLSSYRLLPNSSKFSHVMSGKRGMSFFLHGKDSEVFIPKNVVHGGYTFHVNKLCCACMTEGHSILMCPDIDSDRKESNSYSESTSNSEIDGIVKSNASELVDYSPIVTKKNTAVIQKGNKNSDVIVKSAPKNNNEALEKNRAPDLTAPSSPDNSCMVKNNTANKPTGGIHVTTSVTSIIDAASKPNVEDKYSWLNDSDTESESSHTIHSDASQINMLNDDSSENAKTHKTVASNCVEKQTVMEDDSSSTESTLKISPHILESRNTNKTGKASVENMEISFSDSPNEETDDLNSTKMLKTTKAEYLSSRRQIKNMRRPESRSSIAGDLDHKLSSSALNFDYVLMKESSQMRRPKRRRSIAGDLGREFSASTSDFNKLLKESSQNRLRF